MSEPTRYAQSGDISIAYQVAGEGALDVVLVPGGYTHLEHGQLEPRVVRFGQRLAFVRPSHHLRQARNWALGPDRRNSDQDVRAEPGAWQLYEVERDRSTP